MPGIQNLLFISKQDKFDDEVIDCTFHLRPMKCAIYLHFNKNEYFYKGFIYCSHYTIFIHIKAPFEPFYAYQLSHLNYKYWRFA